MQLTAINRLKEILLRDSEQSCPVLQTVPLFFWQNINVWTQRIVLRQPFIIALTGPSGSGKSFIRKALVEQLAQVAPVSAFTQDNYYRDFEADFPHISLERFYDEVDFDDPAHIRFRHLAADLESLRKLPLGDRMRIQQFRFGTPTSKPTIVPGGRELSVAPFIITEGIHAFYDPALLPLYDLKIYVDIDEATRRERWLARNREENRGTTDNMWNTTVACLKRHILPTRSLADMVINNQAPREQVVAFLREIVTGLSMSAPLSQQEIA